MRDERPGLSGEHAAQAPSERPGTGAVAGQLAPWALLVASYAGWWLIETRSMLALGDLTMVASVLSLPATLLAALSAARGVRRWQRNLAITGVLLSAPVFWFALATLAVGHLILSRLQLTN